MNGRSEQRRQRGATVIDHMALTRAQLRAANHELRDTRARKEPRSDNGLSVSNVGRALLDAPAITLLASSVLDSLIVGPKRIVPMVTRAGIAGGLQGMCAPSSDVKRADSRKITTLVQRTFVVQPALGQRVSHCPPTAGMHGSGSTPLWRLLLSPFLNGRNRPAARRYTPPRGRYEGSAQWCKPPCSCPPAYTISRPRNRFRTTIRLSGRQRHQNVGVPRLVETQALVDVSIAWSHVDSRRMNAQQYPWEG